VKGDIKTEPVSVREIGSIREIRKSIVKVEGLSDCMLGQIVNFSDNQKGFVMGFNEKDVLLLLLQAPKGIKAGDTVYSEKKVFKIPTGDKFLGRIINPLCEPLDGKPPVEADNFTYIFSEAPSVLDRTPLEKKLVTGIRIIDSCISVARGQRQLIVGDRMTGKTSLAVDALLNQKGEGVICIYCCIGRDYASFENVVNTFKKNGAMDYMIVVSALASSSIGEQYLAPYAAATLGEHFMYSGRDVFIVFDDLTKHAWAYRELSLLLERPPGREAYPGDIFYLHAQLMERAAKLSPQMGGGSMSFFAIADTLQGDIAGFIPTNLISMTDGQIYLNSSLFGEGFKPAVDLALSVSRIGNKVQSAIMKELVRNLALNYIQYRELLKATRLRAGISEESSAFLRRGEKIERIFTQEKNCLSPIAEQIILFYALKSGALDILPDERCDYFKKNILKFAQANFSGLTAKLEREEELTTSDRKELSECIVRFFKEA